LAVKTATKIIYEDCVGWGDKLRSSDIADKFECTLQVTLKQGNKEDHLAVRSEKCGYDSGIFYYIT